MFTLYTIGHSNLSAEAFLSLLKQHHITTLVDVRSVPYSRYSRHFTKQPLQTFLEENGVNYRYAGEYLGGRPNDPTVYNELPDPEYDGEEITKKVDYEKVIQRDWYLKGIERLLELVRELEQHKQRIAIMCAEADPLHCHRHHMIARSLIDPQLKVIRADVNVVHILRDGGLKSVCLEDFQQASDGLTQPMLF